MDTPNSTRPSSTTATAAGNLPTVNNTANTNSSSIAANKYSYSAPASPIAVVSINNPSNIIITPSIPTSSSSTTPTPTPNNRTPMTPTTSANNMSAAYAAYAAISPSALSTPKKNFLDAVTLEAIRNKLRTPNGICELQSLRWEHAVEPVNVIKGRYLICARESHLTTANSSAKTASLFRHRIDLTSSNIKCTDIFTTQEFLCKIINEPLHKVQRAYFALKQDVEGCQSTIYGHTLIRDVHDIVPLSKNRTYIIIAPTPQPPPTAWSTPTAQEQYVNGTDNWGVYEDLHTYIRNKRRLCETEARSLFHQICQTVQVCHRNGIILRDLKLKRFYFIDEARTKLQYESLEGSMILDDINDDTLSDKIGCPLYTAPELLCPNPTYHGKPADMWSLGVILYTMLVGQYPFYERGNYNLITVIRHCHVQIPSSLSRSVRWLLLALLRKNFEERMTSAQIFISPWLKEQRPFYMYIPVDVVVGDFDDDDDAENCHDMDEEIMDEYCAPAAQDDDENDVGVQPLDYTCATLCNNNTTRSVNHVNNNNNTGSSSSSTSSSSNHSNATTASDMHSTVQDIEMST